MKPIGSTHWALADHYIPSWSHGPSPEMESHEAICLLNTSGDTARIELTLYFAEREPAGPYRFEVPARRTKHIRLNNLADPEAVPRGVDFASVVRSNVPVVVQHTRLDSRQSENAIFSTIAFAG